MVTPEKLARLARGLNRPALPAEKQPKQVFEARGALVTARIGDRLVWECVAQSAAAARAIVAALRNLENLKHERE
jgi:hypothetical protein